MARVRNVSYLILLFLSVLYLSGTITLAAQDIALIQYGEPAEGALASGQTVEYRFVAEAGDPVIIVVNTKGGEIDPFVQLFTSEGALIAEDDDSGGKYNARIDDVTLPDAGEYRVQITNQASGSSGNYSIIVNNETQVIAYHGGGIDEPFSADPGYLGYQLSEPWHTTNLTYYIVNVLPEFAAEDVEQVIAESFQAWANNTPLNFTRVYDESANIIVQFTQIDGSSQVLGQACPPSSPCAGSVEFDIDENWILYEPQQYNDISLLGVATHEFGHIVGLLHSSDTNALMYPQYSPYNLQPSNDDIAGVQRLYGAGQGGVIGQPTTAPGGGGEGEGNVVTSVINDSQYVEFWDFDVSAGEYVTITMEALSGGLDPLLVILDQNDQVLAYDDDSAGNLNAVVRNIRFPQSGTYTAAATRFEQVQGYTEGNYQLTLDFGFSEAPEGLPTSVASADTAVPTGGGSVQISRPNADALASLPNLASVLSEGFVDSVTPLEQSASGTVSATESYIWSVTWCALSAQALERSLEAIKVSFAIEDQPVAAERVFVSQSQQDGLSCADYAVQLSGWSGGSVNLTATMTLFDPAFDGRAIYQPGDYVYQYAIRVN